VITAPRQSDSGYRNLAEYDRRARSVQVAPESAISSTLAVRDSVREPGDVQSGTQALTCSGGQWWSA
jgi:hypothetical protein